LCKMVVWKLCWQLQVGSAIRDSLLRPSWSVGSTEYKPPLTVRLQSPPESPEVLQEKRH